MDRKRDKHSDDPEIEKNRAEWSLEQMELAAQLRETDDHEVLRRSTQTSTTRLCKARV
jgi:hypothetical protein